MQQPHRLDTSFSLACNGSTLPTKQRAASIGVCTPEQQQEHTEVCRDALDEDVASVCLCYGASAEYRLLCPREYGTKSPFGPMNSASASSVAKSKCQVQDNDQMNCIGPQSSATACEVAIMCTICPLARAGRQDPESSLPLNFFIETLDSTLWLCARCGPERGRSASKHLKHVIPSRVPPRVLARKPWTLRIWCLLAPARSPCWTLPALRARPCLRSIPNVCPSCSPSGAVVLPFFWGDFWTAVASRHVVRHHQHRPQPSRRRG